jgi:hypothetical protein
MLNMKAAITLLLLFSFSCTFAQAPNSNVAVPQQQRSPMFLRDVFSSPFEPKPYAGIQGSPYIEDRWILARIKFDDTRRIIDSLLIKINVYDSKIHFRNENGEEMQMTLRVEEIKIIDSSSTMMNKVFLSGLDQQAGFFEILAEGGKLKLLKKYKAFVWETKPLGSEPQRKFEMENELFLSRDKIFYRTSKNCLSIRDAVGNNDKVLDYISTNNIHCNKEEDMRKLVTFYAALKE